MGYREAIEKLQLGAFKTEATESVKLVHGKNETALRSSRRAVALLAISVDYIFTKTITMVNRVRDSMKARPSTRNSMMPARVPGLRASDSQAEPTARP